jgi:putative ABC transport system permease protein
MSRLYLLLLRRHYLKAWRPSLLTILGLGLGVAVFVSIHLSVGASLRSFKNTVEAVTGKAEWQVTQEGPGLPEDLFPTIKLHPAVEAATPVVEYMAPLSHQPNQTLWVLGVDFINDGIFRMPDPSFSSINEEEFMAWLTKPGAVALSETFARAQGIKKGDRLEVLVNGRPRTLTVVFLFKHDTRGQTFEDHLALMDIGQAQEVFGKIGRLDRIDVIFNKEKSSAFQVKALEQVLPPGARLSRPAEREQGTERMIRSYQLNLTALSFIAVLVSMYLIYNTTSLSVARRRRELGILRSLGMLPGQMLGLILFEAAGYGFLGGLLGLAGGYGLAKILLGTVAQTITNLYVLVGVKQITISFGEVLGVTLLSTLLAMASALLPARQAAKVEPREILYRRAGLMPSASRDVARTFFIGLGFLVLSSLLIFIPPWREWPIGGLSATLSLTLGFSFLLPILTRTVINWGLAFRKKNPNGWISGTLGLYYVNRYLKRMTVSMAALMTAIAMLISVTVMIKSFRQAVDIWIQQSISGDLFVGPILPSNQGFHQFLDPQVIQEISSMEAIADVYHYRGLISELQGQPLRIWVGDLKVIERHGGLAFTEGDGREIFGKAVTRGEILASEVLANRMSLKPGSSIRLMTAEGPQFFRIAGIFYDYRTEGGAVWMDRSLYRTWWRDDRINGLRLYLKQPDQAPQVKEAITSRLAGRYNLAIMSHRELRQQILNIFDQTFQVTYVLEAIAMVVAFLGLIHSSTISVLFREKELGILKALGAQPSQIRNMILTETLFMGFISYLGGVTAGSLLSLILIQVINKQSFGWTIPFYWSGITYAQTLGVVLLGSFAAGLIPASLANQGKTQQMIREE